MAAKGSNVSENWPKWQIALGIGAPVVLGLAGVWYWRRRNKSAKPPKTAKVDKLKPDDLKEKTEKEDTEPLTPLQQAQGCKSKGNKYFKGEKFENAVACYTEAIKLCPPEHKSDIATFYQNRAAAYDKLKQADNVINDCTEALTFNKRYTKALNRRAKAHEAKGNFSQALEDLTATCILESFENASTLEMLERILTEAAKVEASAAYAKRKPSYPSAHFMSSYFMAFANDPTSVLVKSTSSDNSPDEKYTEESSEKELNQANAEHIEGSSAGKKSSPYLQAVADLKAQKYTNILKLCGDEMESEGAEYPAEARLLRASMYLLRGESAKAMTDFDELLKMNNTSKKVRCNALIKRGTLLMQDGKETEALNDFAAAVREDQDNSDIYHHRGQMNLLMQRVEDAVRDFERSVQLNPDFSIAQVQKIYTEYKQAQMMHSPLQMSEAMKNFEKAIARFSDCSEGYALYGQALSDQQQFDEADKYFKKAIEMEPDNGNNYVHRGLLMLQWKQDINEATRLIETALRVDDKCGFAYETLGTIEVQRGNLDKTIELMGKALNTARTEIEMTLLYKQFLAVSAQRNVAVNMGIMAPSLAGL